MTSILTALARLLAWLGERDGEAVTWLPLRDWADLPPHHPAGGIQRGFTSCPQ